MKRSLPPAVCFLVSLAPGVAFGTALPEAAATSPGESAPVRQSEETVRQSEETVRQSEETVRQSEETVRQSEETVRQSEETVRQSEETLRIDLHSHPSRFHRANVPRISDEEIARYLDRGMDAVVATISTDTPYRGGYVLRDGTRIESGNRRPDPAEPWEYTLDRFERLTRTAAEGRAVFVRTPAEARKARAEGVLGILPALEGADSLEGAIGRLHQLHEMGLALVQLVHFRPNGLGHIQTWPYTPGGLTEFGREVVRECNRLGIVIDLAHANPETIRDTLELSRAPVIFSHTGAFALGEADRNLRDPEIQAIAAAGGVIGIWPNGSLLPTVADMARHIRYVTDLGGMDAAGIGSDLRGMSAYSEGFGEEANFEAIAEALAEAGFDSDEVEGILGANFERVWEEVTAHLTADDNPPGAQQ